jgi:hypothetical protein
MPFGDIQRRRGQGVPVTSKFDEQFAVAVVKPGHVDEHRWVKQQAHQ